MNARTLLLLLALLPAAQAGATPPWTPAVHDRGPPGRAHDDRDLVRAPRRDGVSLGRAVEMAKRAVGGGRVLSAETRDQGGRVVYRIKLLTRGGEVRSVYVDADSGDMQE